VCGWGRNDYLILRSDPTAIIMSVMKTFCGCMSTKSGTTAVIGLGIVLYIAEIVFTSLRLDGGMVWLEDEVEVPAECKTGSDENKGEHADTWWCRALVDLQLVEENLAIIKICCNSVLLITSLLGIYAVNVGTANLLLPYIVLEFLQLAGYSALIITMVVVLGVYSPGGVDLSTTISVAAIGILTMTILFYFWLCVVSLYQTLREIKQLGSDKVKILQFQEDSHQFQDDSQPYNKFGTAAGYDPHSDDYPVNGEDDQGSPPTYRPPSSPRPPVQEAKVEDLV